MYAIRSYYEAQLCLRGRELVYDFCARRAIGHSRIGKVIFAAHDEQVGKDDAIKS